MLYFGPDSSICPICGEILHVKKNRTKSVATMDIGTFKASETILGCPKCDKIYFSEKLRKLIPYRCKFGYDIIVHIGKNVFIRCRSEKEIMHELSERNIVISESEIHYLSKKFIIYLAIAHKESREKLKQFMNRNGGYILHLDATCEGDSPHLMSGLDGISEIVLENVKLPSEKAETIIPFLENIKKAYGNPLALVHDMGKGILAAVKKVFPNIADYIGCSL